VVWIELILICQQQSEAPLPRGYAFLLPFKRVGQSRKCFLSRSNEWVRFRLGCVESRSIEDDRETGIGTHCAPALRLSDTLSESEIYDYGLFRVRQQLTRVPGTLLPTPYGGVARQIMVDLDQNALLAKGLTPIDVTAAINAQNVTLPSGTAKVGSSEYTVSTNSSPVDALMLNDVPIKTVNGSLVYMRDVAHVRDGWSVQQNVARANGKPAALLAIMKTGSVSTLDIVNQIKNDVLPASRAAAPKGLKITELFDQSIFVKASIVGVLREGVIAASLTALMILLLPGQLAEHSHHCDFDSPLDSQLDHRT
jgi:multidrug efflux pump subunit AcrB